MPKGGSWTPLKNEATDFVQGTGSANITPASLLTNFIRAAGGLAGLMRGHGGAAPSGSGATRTSAGTKGATGGGRRSRNIGRRRDRAEPRRFSLKRSRCRA